VFDMIQARGRVSIVHRSVLFVAMTCAALIGCGSDDDGGGGTPVPTASSTPTGGTTPVATATPVLGAAVRGLVVVDAAVAANEGDALRGAPEFSFANPHFDRSLSFADWSLHCDGQAGEDLTGTTDEFGRFVVADVPPGDCILLVTKTVSGNLMSFIVPFSVGDDGAAEVIAEVSWGRVRATSLYSIGGSAYRRITVGGGSHALIRDGQLIELADSFRRLVDEDGDGRFTAPNCGGAVWECTQFGACGEDRRCGCAASCPLCEDCPSSVCTASNAPVAYACDPSGGCAGAGDVCVCAPSAPDARDCPQSVCVPSCADVEFDEISAFGTPSLVVGYEGYYSAVGVLSDGSSIDLTGLVDWVSSDRAVLDVTVWGSALAVSEGNVVVTASLGGVMSGGVAVEVTPRPALVNIHLQNYDCYYYFDGPPRPQPGPDPAIAAPDFAPPYCLNAIEVGGTVQFHALGEFAGGFYEDITDEVEWRATPSSVGSIANGQFLGIGAGTASISAALGGVMSDTREMRVVTERSVVSLSIYPESQYDYGFLPVADIAPCFDFRCSGSLTLLVGDELRFRATARYDTGGWEDVTDRVTWTSTAAGVAPITSAGVLTATGAGDTTVRAALGEIESYPYGVEVVAEATLQSLYIYQGGANAADRVIAAGEEAVFIAQGYYDVGFARDATQTAVWMTSDASIARFDSPGVLTGLAAGDVEAWAELDGVRSPSLPIEVFAQTNVDFCDVENVNRGTWTDGFNRVYLESDCADYTQPGVVQIRFTVTETQRPGGIFDPCLDLYAFRVDGGREIFVRTIREEGCGDPFLAAGAPEFDDAKLRYQLQAFWDLKDDRGAVVAPGTYRIKGRFYLYYDPVVTIDINVD